jgi:two-component system chemotaxis response regulator CheB
MKQLRVLIVDDSAFMRKMIGDMLEKNDGITVIDKAKNGEEAVEKVLQLHPDVVTMDVEMPKVNGLKALQEIMEKKPTPVVMLSSITQKGAETTMLAMQYGAVDFIAKPSGQISLDLHKVQTELVQKVIAAGKANLKAFLRRKGLTTSIKGLTSTTTTATQKTELICQLVCIGTSTGGPRAVQEVLAGLPSNLNAPVLVVQHMPAGFTHSFAKRLDGLSSMIVKEAENNEIIQNGIVYIAPGGRHMRIKKRNLHLFIALSDDNSESIHRPSVDILFESVASLTGYRRIGVIMTGMGSDGTKGIKLLKKSGAVYTIAESEESCMVFGMPKSAIKTNLIDEVCHVKEIPSRIVKFL